MNTLYRTEHVVGNASSEVLLFCELTRHGKVWERLNMAANLYSAPEFPTAQLSTS
jgi:hypothetical protein